MPDTSAVLTSKIWWTTVGETCSSMSVATTANPISVTPAGMYPACMMSLVWLSVAPKVRVKGLAHSAALDSFLPNRCEPRVKAVVSPAKVVLLSD